MHINIRNNKKYYEVLEGYKFGFIGLCEKYKKYKQKEIGRKTKNLYLANSATYRGQNIAKNHPKVKLSLF